MSTGSVLPLDRDTATRHKEDVGVHTTLYCTAPPQHTLPPPVLSLIAFVHSHFIDCLCPLASSFFLHPLTLHRFLFVHSRFISFSSSTHTSSFSLRPLTLHRFLSLRPLTLHRFLSVHSHFIGFSPSTHASSVSLHPLTLHRFLSWSCSHMYREQLPYMYKVNTIVQFFVLCKK